MWEMGFSLFSGEEMMALDERTRPCGMDFRPRQPPPGGIMRRAELVRDLHGSHLLRLFGIDSAVARRNVSRRGRLPGRRRVVVAADRQSLLEPDPRRGAPRGLLGEVRQPKAVRVLAMGRLLRLSRRRSRNRRRQQRVVQLYGRPVVAEASQRHLVARLPCQPGHLVHAVVPARRRASRLGSRTGNAPGW